VTEVDGEDEVLGGDARLLDLYGDPLRFKGNSVIFYGHFNLNINIKIIIHYSPIYIG
jgi:hypothetical protein